MNAFRWLTVDFRCVQVGNLIKKLINLINRKFAKSIPSANLQKWTAVSLVIRLICVRLDCAICEISFFRSKRRVLKSNESRVCRGRNFSLLFCLLFANDLTATSGLDERVSQPEVQTTRLHRNFLSFTRLPATFFRSGRHCRVRVCERLVRSRGHRQLPLQTTTSWFFFFFSVLCRFFFFFASSLDPPAPYLPYHLFIVHHHHYHYQQHRVHLLLLFHLPLLCVCDHHK